MVSDGSNSHAMPPMFDGHLGGSGAAVGDKFLVVAGSDLDGKVRDHPFKTSANFHEFLPLPPYHRQSSKMLMKGIFDPYVL